MKIKNSSKKKNKHSKNAAIIALILITAVVIQLLTGLNSYKTFVIEDAAIHAELITPVIKTQVYPLSYSPIADVSLTYPILFHYIASIFTGFGIDAMTSARILGLLAFMLFPIALYCLGSLFGRRIGLIAAVLSVLVSNFTVLILFSAFPQMLAMSFLCFAIYFFFKNHKINSGIFFGLTLLTHSFLGMISVIVFALLMFRESRENKKEAKKTLSYTGIAGLIVSAPWLYQYSWIIVHAIRGSWNNTAYYELNSGFLAYTAFIEYAGRLNIFILLFSLAGLWFFIKEMKKDSKKEFFAVLYVLCAAFTLYHFTPTQLKFLDTLTIPLLVAGAYGIEQLLKFKEKTKKTVNVAVTVILIILLLVSLPAPYLITEKYQKLSLAITPEEQKAAEFLKKYDSEHARISGEVTSEALFAALSGKIPLDAKISDLEEYTPKYKQQLKNKKTLQEMNGKNAEILQKYKIKYYVSKICDFNVIYNDRIRICEVK